VESRIATFYQPLVEGMTSYAITSPLQMAHFLAQIGLESGNFLTPKSWPAIRWWRWMPPAGSGTSRTT
jgi:hypothetical protein